MIVNEKYNKININKNLREIFHMSCYVSNLLICYPPEDDFDQFGLR